MPGLEPAIQAVPPMIIRRTSALDARVKPAHDDPESVARLCWRRLTRKRRILLSEKHE
jgi:hypothetical protein